LLLKIQLRSDAGGRDRTRDTPPIHSNTSSARDRNDAGIVSPIALAVVIDPRRAPLRMISATMCRGRCAVNRARSIRHPRSRHVLFAPKADKEQIVWVSPLCATFGLVRRSKTALVFDDLVDAGERPQRHRDAEHLSGLQIGNELDLSRLLNRKIYRLLAMGDSIHISSCPPEIGRPHRGRRPQVRPRQRNSGMDWWSGMDGLITSTNAPFNGVRRDNARTTAPDAITL
jgi:hypothetical protein